MDLRVGQHLTSLRHLKRPFTLLHTQVSIDWQQMKLCGHALTPVSQLTRHKGNFNEKLTLEYMDHKGEIRAVKLPISGDGSQVYTLAPAGSFNISYGLEN